MVIRREKRRKKVAGLGKDKPGFQPLDISSDPVTPADGRGWDDSAPLALGVVLSEDEKNRIVKKAHREFIRSGIVIRDVFGSLT